MKFFALNGLLFVLGPSDVRVMTRQQLFNVMQRQDLTNITEKLDFLEKYLIKLDNYSDEQIQEIKHNFSHFKFQMKKKGP